MTIPAYGVSKGGVNTLTLYVAAQYGKQGIRCNAVAPGLVLGTVHRKHGAIGTELAIGAEDGPTAIVCDLPFTGS